GRRRSRSKSSGAVGGPAHATSASGCDRCCNETTGAATPIAVGRLDPLSNDADSPPTVGARAGVWRVNLPWPSLSQITMSPEAVAATRSRSPSSSMSLSISTAMAASSRTSAIEPESRTETCGGPSRFWMRATSSLPSPSKSPNTPCGGAAATYGSNPLVRPSDAMSAEAAIRISSPAIREVLFASIATRGSAVIAVSQKAAAAIQLSFGYVKTRTPIPDDKVRNDNQLLVPVAAQPCREGDGGDERNDREAGIAPDVSGLATARASSHARCCVGIGVWSPSGGRTRGPSVVRRSGVTRESSCYGSLERTRGGAIHGSSVN